MKILGSFLLMILLSVLVMGSGDAFGYHNPHLPILDASVKSQTNVIAYGEMWNYTSAGWNFDVDIADVYYNLTGLVFGMNENFLFEDRLMADGGSLLITQVRGEYKVSFSMSFASLGQGGEYGISLHHDFNPDTHRSCYARRDAALATGNVGIECMINMEVGDTLGVMIENEDNNRDMTIYTVNLNAVRIGD